ncbi:MAG: BlaI/MecI/CopY family transcriptional regulator [Bryobacteraceae bacterium]|jgi:predicted transcriptional regulator
MALPKLTKLELQIMETLWSQGPSSIRAIQEAFPRRARGAPPPAYTTVQTIVYRLEWKKAVRRTKKVGNAHVFEAAISRDLVRGRMIDELLGFFGGRALPIMAHLIDSRKLTPDEVREARKALRDLARKDKGQ